AEGNGREEAARAVSPDQQALDRGCGRRAALSAARSLRREQAHRVEGAQRREDQGGGDDDQVGADRYGWGGGGPAPPPTQWATNRTQHGRKHKHGIKKG